MGRQPDKARHHQYCQRGGATLSRSEGNLLEGSSEDSRVSSSHGTPEASISCRVEWCSKKCQSICVDSDFASENTEGKANSF